MPETMTVTVVDRAAQAATWGYAPGGAPPLRTVEIARICPACGGPRGEPRHNRQCEDGEFYYVHVWTNPCGHLDKYEAVLREADAAAVRA